MSEPKIPTIVSHGVRKTLTEAGYDWQRNKDGSYRVRVGDTTQDLMPMDEHETVIHIGGNPRPLKSV